LGHTSVLLEELKGGRTVLAAGNARQTETRAQHVHRKTDSLAAARGGLVAPCTHSTTAITLPSKTNKLITRPFIKHLSRTGRIAFLSKTKYLLTENYIRKLEIIQIV